MDYKDPKQFVGDSDRSFPLTRRNILLMIAAGVMIVVGFLLMSGGASTETEFNPDIFSTRRIVVGPTIAFLGFVLMAVGIIWGGRENSGSEAGTPQE